MGVVRWREGGGGSPGRCLVCQVSPYVGSGGVATPQPLTHYLDGPRHPIYNSLGGGAAQY